MYIPRSRREREEMLKAVGVGTVEELLDQVPADLLRDEPLDVPPPMSEFELTAHMKDLAASNAGAAYRIQGRVPHGIHALSAGGEPGNPSGDIRVPVHDLRVDRYGGVERFTLRRGFWSG